MRAQRKLLVSTVVFGLCAAVASAQTAELPREYIAREGLMTLMGMNIGVVGGMARGNTEYNAEAAQEAADSLAGIAMISQAALWTDATLSDSLDVSRALPKISEDRAGFDAEWDKFVTAAMAFQAAAGQGPEAMGAALGAVGQSCGSCHDNYRKPQE